MQQLRYRSVESVFPLQSPLRLIRFLLITVKVIMLCSPSTERQKNLSQASGKASKMTNVSLIKTVWFCCSPLFAAVKSVSEARIR